MDADDGKGWGEVTSKIGEPCPADYMQFVDRFGSGTINQFLTGVGFQVIMCPFAAGRCFEPAASLAEPKARADAAGASAENEARRAPSAPLKSLGTGHGRVETSTARYVEFERDSDTPSEQIAIHYDTHANLVARGVIRDERRWPAPFPGGFVPAPPSGN